MAAASSASLIGCKPFLIKISVKSFQGLPKLVFLGMSRSRAVEIRDKITAAIKVSGYRLRSCRTVINLRPAAAGECDQLELAAAVGLLAENDIISADYEQTLIVGSLDLDGSVKPIPGILSYLRLAKELGLDEVILPAGNYHQAQLVNGIDLIPATNLQQVVRWLNCHQRPKCDQPQPKKDKREQLGVNFSDVIGQDLAKRALTLAAAGRHHILLVGPPGVGKTMLAECARKLLPRLSSNHIKETTEIYCLDQHHSQVVVKQPPFRQPQMNISSTEFFGGGRWLRPGEVSLAHHGVLFIDELPQLSRSILAGLAQVLESKQIKLTRNIGTCSYPADVMLIAAMNPCPCGYYQTNLKPCQCGPAQRDRYWQRLSGALLDRIDLIVRLQPVKMDADSQRSNSQPVEIGKQQIKQIWDKQQQRYQHLPAAFNSDLDSRHIRKLIRLDSNCRRLLQEAAANLKLSTRTYFKVIKLARTIADLADESAIQPAHIQEALSYTADSKLRDTKN